MHMYLFLAESLASDEYVHWPQVTMDVADVGGESKWTEVGETPAGRDGTSRVCGAAIVVVIIFCKEIYYIRLSF